MLIPNHSVNNTCEFCAGQTSVSERLFCTHHVRCVLRMIDVLCQILFSHHLEIMIAPIVFSHDNRICRLHFESCLLSNHKLLLFISPLNNSSFTEKNLHNINQTKINTQHDTKRTGEAAPASIRL